MRAETRSTEYLASCPPQLQYIHQAGLRAYGRLPAIIVELFSPEINQLPLRGQRWLNQQSCRLAAHQLPDYPHMTKFSSLKRHLMLKTLN